MEENARIKAAILIWHSFVCALESSGFKAAYDLSGQDPCLPLYAGWVPFPDRAVIWYFVFFALFNVSS